MKKVYIGIELTKERLQSFNVNPEVKELINDVLANVCGDDNKKSIQRARAFLLRIWISYDKVPDYHEAELTLCIYRDGFTEGISYIKHISKESAFNLMKR